MSGRTSPPGNRAKLQPLDSTPRRSATAAARPGFALPATTRGIASVIGNSSQNRICPKAISRLSAGGQTEVCEPARPLQHFGQITGIPRRYRRSHRCGRGGEGRNSLGYGRKSRTMSFDVRLPGEAQDIVADSRRQWCSGARNRPALRELRILLRENYSRITLLSSAIGIERPHYRVSLTSLSLRGPGYVVGN